MKRFFKLNDTGKGYSELTKSQFIAYKKAGKHFFINLGYALMETSETEYRDFCKKSDRQKYLKILAEKYGVFSYHGIELDDGEVSGEEILHDKSVNVEETAIEAVFSEAMLPKLSEAITTLTADDRELVHYIFYEKLSEREIERKYSIPRKTVSYRKKRILEKLKLFMD